MCGCHQSCCNCQKCNNGNNCSCQKCNCNSCKQSSCSCQKQVSHCGCQSQSNCGCQSQSCCKSCNCQGGGCNSHSCCQKSGCGCQSQSCQESGCSCCQKQKNCGDDSCHEHECESCGEEHEDSCYSRAYELLELADEAWMEVLKEKLKEKIRASDTKIDQLAEIVSETNRQRWHNKMAEDQACCDYTDKLKDLMDQHHSDANSNQGSTSGRQTGSDNKWSRENPETK